MFRQILVPVDFTPNNQKALAVARKLAEQNAASIAVLHVIETIDYLGGQEIDQFYQMLSRKAEAEFDLLRQSLADTMDDVQTNIVIGKRAPEIVRFAVDHEIDLIVMSSHRVDLTDDKPSWGTLSHQVSIVCPCAVLLVK